MCCETQIIFDFPRTNVSHKNHNICVFPVFGNGTQNLTILVPPFYQLSYEHIIKCNPFFCRSYRLAPQQHVHPDKSSLATTPGLGLWWGIDHYYAFMRRGQASSARVWTTVRHVHIHGVFGIR